VPAVPSGSSPSGVPAAPQLNVLQVHLTDDQSFPFQSATHPNLTLHGAFSVAETYSHADLAGLVAFAADRGIAVQVETDTPGHAGGWRGEAGFLAEPGGYPDVSTPATIGVLSDVLGELAATGANGTHHLGGDEVEVSAWSSNPKVAAWAAAQGLPFSGGCCRAAPSGIRPYNATDCSVLCRWHMEHAKAARAGALPPSTHLPTVALTNRVALMTTPSHVRWTPRELTQPRTPPPQRDTTTCTCGRTPQGAKA
jgi:hypothetical protein